MNEPANDARVRKRSVVQIVIIWPSATLALTSADRTSTIFSAQGGKSCYPVYPFSRYNSFTCLPYWHGCKMTSVFSVNDKG